jgi:hypothetical protein
MKPVDFRDATFASLREDLAGMRKGAYEAWVVYGPGTTRAVAQASGIDLLTFRPRTTELVQAGLVVVEESEKRESGNRETGTGTEGVYRVARPEEWERWRAGIVEGQLQLI